MTENAKRILRRRVFALACFVTFVALFYSEENWRGRRAWENCKRDLESKGEVLDWEGFIPPPVPDDQNFYKAPKMADWFIRREPYGSNEITGRLGSFKTVPRPASSNDSVLVAELTVAPLQAAPDLSQAGSVVRLDDPAAPEMIEALLRKTIGRGANGYWSYGCLATPLDQIKPARLVVQANKAPSLKELVGLLPTNVFESSVLKVSGWSHLSLDPAGGNSFRVWLSSVPGSAADYLAWSDQFEPEFELMRQAFKRPYARMDGYYQQPRGVPIQNFIAVRTVAETLAQRAQCQLLLGQPESALLDLSLIHGLCRILEARPSGKPMTLVAAMINVAVTGLYLDAISDGLRWQVWREPQLAALEGQLEEINLLPLLSGGFRCQRASLCRTLETTPSRELPKLFFVGGQERNFREQLFFHLAPRGWVYQNMSIFAVLEQKWCESIEPAKGLILAHNIDELALQLGVTINRFSPRTFLASIAIPSFARACQTLARNQTLANEALIACGLERYRLAHGEFPEHLDGLAPQFVETLPHDVIGGQPLKYHRTDNSRFVLYSVGWNEQDDGGVPGKSTVEGDWVWR